VLYNNEVYTGRSVGNRTSSGIYHQRNHAAPKPTNVDPSILATAKTLPVKLRPSEEWFKTEQPLLKNLLGDEQLRALAIDGQDRYWNHIADPNRIKRSKSKHRGSDYLLSGILTAKQDGGPLVGVLCGRVDHKVRYYRHRRGRTGYMKGSVFNKLIHAETVEKAVMNAVKDALLNTVDLKELLVAILDAESQSAVSVDVEALKKQREALKKRVELIVATFDEESLADAQSEMQKLHAQRRTLDEQIAAATAAARPKKIDVESVAKELMEEIENFFDNLVSLPTHLLKESLRLMITKLTVDMKTKALEIEVGLPKAMLQTAFFDEKAMRLVTTSESSTAYQTHQHVALAAIDCDWIKKSNQICYNCRRIAA
jgi:hypothetical protein